MIEIMNWGFEIDEGQASNCTIVDCEDLTNDLLTKINDKGVAEIPGAGS